MIKRPNREKEIRTDKQKSGEKESFSIQEEDVLVWESRSRAAVMDCVYSSVCPQLYSSMLSFCFYLFL